MLVITRNSDNTQTTYSFDPQHKEEAIGFYTKLHWQGKIRGFTVVLPTGETFPVGA
jgi:hypothetical protein